MKKSLLFFIWDDWRQFKRKRKTKKFRLDMVRDRLHMYRFGSLMKGGGAETGRVHSRVLSQVTSHGVEFTCPDGGRGVV